MLFPSYYLDDHHTGQVLPLHTKEYVLAGLLASLYVYWRTDLHTFVRAFLTNIAFLVVAAVSVLAASSLPGAYALIAAIAIPIILALLQSRAMIRYIVSYHAVNGWDVTKV